jgi:hypothetical protein
MPVDISISDKNLILKLKGSDLAPRHESQLSFWGFHFDATVNGFKCEPENLAQLLIKLTKYFNRNNIRFELNKKAGDIFNEHIKTSGELHNALQIGNTLKDGIKRTPSKGGSSFTFRQEWRKFFCAWKRKNYCSFGYLSKTKIT